MLTNPRPAALPRCSPEVETLPVVGDRQLNAVRRAGQRHVDTACLGMLRHVAERLLGNSIQAQRGIGLDVPHVGVGTVGDRDRVQLLELGAIHAQRRDEAGVLEQAGMQVVGDVPDFLGQRDRVLLRSA